MQRVYVRDDGGDEGYTWTYYYTVIAWNDAAINLLVNHDDADNFCKAGTGAVGQLLFLQKLVREHTNDYRSFIF